jgi:cytochrome c-type biogenesis protein
MHLADYSLALVSGVLVLLSPCSYPLLPGYVVYYLGSKVSGGRAIQGGLACGMGLVTVFSTLGLATYSFGSALLKSLPFTNLVAVAAIGLLGVSLLLGINLPSIPINIHASKKAGLLGFFLYGVTYAVASMACSGPIFISIMLYALTAGDFFDGFTIFLAFSLGMCMPLLATTVLVATAKSFIVRKITGATSIVQRASGVMLIVLAVYLYFLF